MSKVWGLGPGGAPRKAGSHLELLERRDSRAKLGMKYVHVLKNNNNNKRKPKTTLCDLQHLSLANGVLGSGKQKREGEGNVHLRPGGACRVHRDEPG